MTNEVGGRGVSDLNPYESPQESGVLPTNPQSPLWLPAWGILALSALSLGMIPIVISIEFGINHYYFQSSPPTEDIIYSIWLCLTAIAGIVGSIAMLRMKNRRVVVATAILACVPYIGIAGGCFTSPFGLIALTRLRRKEVWDAFQS